MQWRAKNPNKGQKMKSYWETMRTNPRQTASKQQGKKKKVRL